MSVIVPVWREGASIASAVGMVLAEPGAECVVVDGEPGQTTLAVLRETYPQGHPRLALLASPPGRGAQMNAGAAHARGRMLLFLHADTRLPGGWADALRSVLGAGFARCGAFSLLFDTVEGEGSAGTLSRWTDRAFGAVYGRWATLRSRLDRRPYGDQAQFFDAAFFRELGGYPDQPLMEDVELMTRAARAGFPACILPLAVVTSPRRYRSQGWLRRGLGNLRLRAAYALGADPRRLARQYHGQRNDPER
ncbi:MAG: TIGR04283 family arsenosugar biosynthesis glycosyltransferase [Desulfovibrionaceae bacterium]